MTILKAKDGRRWFVDPDTHRVTELQDGPPLKVRAARKKKR